MVDAQGDELGPTIAISHHQQGKGANCVEGGEDTVAGRLAQEAAFLDQHRLRQGMDFAESRSKLLRIRFLPSGSRTSGRLKLAN